MGKLIHSFEDGWTIVTLEDHDELKRENDVVHNGRACLTNGGWQTKIQSGKMLLMSLRNENDEPRATLLFGDADFIIQTRAGSGYEAYAGCKVYCQSPRRIKRGMKPVVSLQCCPPGYIGGDTSGRTPEYHRVKDWYENLPIPAKYKTWDANSNMSRASAINFLKENNIA